MPRKIVAKADSTNVENKRITRGIKKDCKSTGKKEVIDKAVIGNKGKTHYILMLDDSGSMAGRPFRELQAAVSEFLTTLSNSKEAKSSKISCIMYNSVSRIVFQNKKPTTNLLKKIQFKGG